ncbi:MAG: hypothetical protein V7K48_23880 [Nostoc sp.]
MAFFWKIGLILEKGLEVKLESDRKQGHLPEILRLFLDHARIAK